ncbi:MAG TPA: NAD(P)-dependent oxidoreductase [Candidatus Baltobacteraceae bacterium]|jgi:nucleoside-diphosphate-sugar epimerase|nr:NAD(P)-dependent oxidoreductase [Candidatus Baltobacteraceae bacterium]
MKLLVTGGSGFIGRHLIEHMAAQGHEIANLDIAKPADESHAAYFQPCNIMDGAAVKACFQRFQPEAVVHLAARTDPAPGVPVEIYYAPITGGTQNILDAARSTPSVARVVVTSTQLVWRPECPAVGSEEYRPFADYGRAKMEMEKMTKAANLSCIWTIIRPVLIWGPWHIFYRDTLFRAIQKGYYFHPSGQSAVLALGYVKNIARQIGKLLQADSALVNQKTLYVGDGLFSLVDWINGYSQELTGHNIRYLPRSLIRLLALFGDLYQTVTKRRFVMDSVRYRNMTDDYTAPLEPTLQLLGPPEISLQQGIKETVAWARKYPGR